MALLLVPQTYATIQAAITAAASGDVIEIMPGTYSETLLISSKNYLTLRKVPGVEGSVVISGASEVVYLANSAGAILSDLTFRLTGSSTSVSLIEGDSVSQGTKLLDCVFDTTLMDGTTNTLQPLIWLYPGTDSVGPLVIARCKFLTGNNKNWRYVVYVPPASSAQQKTIIEGNYFLNTVLRNTSSSRIIYASTNHLYSCTVIVRNNTFNNCTTYSSIARVLGSNGTTDLSSIRIYNNAVNGLEMVSNTAAIFSAETVASTNVFIGYNTVHRTAGLVGAVASPDSGHNIRTTNATMFDADGRLYFTKEGDLANGYELYRTGIADASLTVGQDQISFASPPSRGCYESYAHTQGVSALFVPHRRLNPFNGMTHSGPGGAWTVLTSATKEDFDSPMELASYINACLVGQMSTRYGPLVFYFDLENRRYRMKAMTSIFDLSCSGVSAILFGTQSLSGVSDTG